MVKAGYSSAAECVHAMQGVTDQLTSIKHMLGTTLRCQQSKPPAQRQTDSGGTVFVLRQGEEFGFEEGEYSHCTCWERPLGIA